MFNELNVYTEFTLSSSITDARNKGVVRVRDMIDHALRRACISVPQAQQHEQDNTTPAGLLHACSAPRPLSAGST
jgi:hypothetical protein